MATLKSTDAWKIKIYAADHHDLLVQVWNEQNSRTRP